jgi:cytochrome c2
VQASLQQRRFLHCASARAAPVAPISIACLLALGLLGGCRPDAPESPKIRGDAKQGRVLLARFQCGACHKIPGVEGAAGTAGPPLTDMASRSYIAGHLPNDPEIMVRWIVNPRALHPATTMPAMGVSPEDARHIAAYLYTLK